MGDNIDTKYYSSLIEPNKNGSAESALSSSLYYRGCGSKKDKEIFKYAVTSGKTANRETLDVRMHEEEKKTLELTGILQSNVPDDEYITFLAR